MNKEKIEIRVYYSLSQELENLWLNFEKESNLHLFQKYKFVKNFINGKKGSNIFINKGPGKFSGIRASLATAKALSLANKIDLYGFSSSQINDKNYVEIIDLFNKGLLIKNLIKPEYLS